MEKNIAGSDLNDSFANEIVVNPCDYSPCLNNGTCQISFTGNYVCLCPDNVIGNNMCNTYHLKLLKYCHS